MSELRAYNLAEVLSSLCDRSLIHFDEATGRYEILETARLYAFDWLQASGEVNTTRQRHMVYFLSLAESAEEQIRGSEQAKWLDRLAREHENLRASLGWSQQEGNAEAALRLCGALQRYWWTRGYLSEGREWCERALFAAGGEHSTTARANTLSGAGVLASDQGDYSSARTYHEQSLSMRRAIGDRRGIATSLNNLGNVIFSQGDYALARAYLEESLSTAREVEDRWSMSLALNNLGNVAYEMGDFASARRHQAESLSIARELGDQKGIAISLNNLGFLAVDQGDYVSARDYLMDSLSAAREIGDRWAIALALNSLGDLAFSQGDFASARHHQEEAVCIKREIGDQMGIAYSLEAFASLTAGLRESSHAARLWGAAEALRERIGAPLPPNEGEVYDQRVADARAALGDDAAFDAAWNEGRGMTMEQAVAYAVDDCAGQ